MEADSLSAQDLTGLQRALALADLAGDRPDTVTEGPGSLELLIARFNHVKVEMYREQGPHKRPHFHIEYKRQYRASYTIDTLERIVGYMPRQYERPVLEWAQSIQPRLANYWEHLNSGGQPLEIEIGPSGVV